MQQAQCASFNPALEHVIEIANRDGLPVLIACRAKCPGLVCTATARSTRSDAERE
jgi:hypothetical protein